MIRKRLEEWFEVNTEAVLHHKLRGPCENKHVDIDIEVYI